MEEFAGVVVFLDAFAVSPPSGFSGAVGTVRIDEDPVALAEGVLVVDAVVDGGFADSFAALAAEPGSGDVVSVFGGVLREFVAR